MTKARSEFLSELETMVEKLAEELEVSVQWEEREWVLAFLEPMFPEAAVALRAEWAEE